MKFKDLREQKEPKLIREGTWQVPKTMKELQKLSEMLYVPYPAKTRRKVLQFQKTIPMGDDHMYDVLDDVGMTDERRLQKWDEPVYINVLAGKALEKEGWITGRVTNNGRSYDAKTHGFGELSELEEMTMLPRKKGNLKPSRKMLKLERVSGGKLDPLSKMGKSKLTGQEIAQYYRKNPKAKQAAKDPMVKKAIELALDLGGNQTLAVKEIEKMKKGLSKNSAVANALRSANEDMTSTSSVAMPNGIPLGKVKKRKELEEEKLSPAKKQYYDFNIMRTKLYRFVKAKTKAHKFAIDDLMLMTSPKVIEGMYKRNPRGFTRMMDKMYPNEREKMGKGDFTVLGDFIDARGKVVKGQGHKVDESTSLNEETILYRIKDIQKPELDKFKSSARLMKLKINIKQSPRGKETIIRLEGSKKQIRDFDAVARGKSSYGDPSVVEDAVERAKELADLKAKHKREVEQEKDEIERTKQSAETESLLAQLNSLEEQLDLLEKQFAVKGGGQEFSKTFRQKRSKSSSGKFMSRDDLVAKLKELPDGKNKVKDSNNSLIVRSLARLMNTERRPAAKKGAEFGKGKAVDEMDAPRIKKIIDIVSKGISITKKGDKMMRDKKELNAFSDLDTYTRDEVEGIISKTSDGSLYKLVYEGTELNEESATMKKVRQVIKKKGMMNIDGTKLDLTTASMIASVYDKVNPQNKKRMDSLKLPQLINLTMKVAGKSRKESVQTESLWANIHNKRKRGEKMRKPGEKGAPKPGDFERARGEAVSPAQQAAIAISKKERGEKPKNECADEKDFKPHKMYKGDKEVMANTYDDHVKYDKMGYTHEKPKKEALDAKDKPFVKDLVKKLRGGSKTHAKQADDLEKAMNTESMSRARRDAMRDMGKRKDKDDDGYGTATDDDRKAADKNVIMQIRKVADLPKGGQIELPSGKKVKMDRKSAIALNKKFDSIRKPQDKLKLQKMMNDKKISVVALKRLLGK